jgi:predicted RNase H-like HicB family nuclease
VKHSNTPFPKEYSNLVLTHQRKVLYDPFSRLFIDQIEKGGEMKAEFTAIIEAAPEGGYWAICPEVPGANGQGETIEETKNNLREAIELILEDRKADIFRGLPKDIILEKVQIG